MTPTRIPITPATPVDLDPRFAAVKKELVRPEHRVAVKESWKRLLKALDDEYANIEREGSAYVPQLEWADIVSNDYKLPSEIEKKFRTRGVIMVNGVVDAPQITSWFDYLVEFCKKHPETAGYTFPNPTAWYNVFWTKAQNEARSHPNIQKVVKVMSRQFYASPETLLDVDSQVVYGDRIRIRPPGKDATLPLHLDSSSSERWEDPTYREVYREIFEGRWEDWDPFKMDARAYAVEDLYEGVVRSTTCSAFRSLQGWLALSDNKSGEGTLRVLPNIRLVIAYIMLRPLFWKDPASGNPDDYELDLDSPKFPGVVPSEGQLYTSPALFPHLSQERSVVSIPDVKKGTFVFWHADLAHEVDKHHNGPDDSSVFYYGVAPLSVPNISTLLDTRKSFEANISPVDYRSQLKEEDRAKEFQGASLDDIPEDPAFRRSMGLLPYDTEESGLTPGQKAVRELANDALEKNVFSHHGYLASMK
ncbi:hypothetical protein DICA4_F06040 [Diutina catenulata]